MEATESKKFDIWSLLGGDKALWVIIIMLGITSIPVIYSAAASIAYRIDSTTSHFFVAQAAMILLSFLVIYVVHRINYQTYARFAHLLFIFALLLTALTFFVGSNFNDAQRWIRVPIIGITFQPSDFLKVALVMILARALSVRQKTISKSSLMPHFRARRGETNRDILFDTTIPLLLPIFLACGVIFKANLSTAAITFVTCCIMLYIGRVKVWELIRLVTIVLVVVTVLVSIMSAADIGRGRTWTNRIKSHIGLMDKTDEGYSDDQLQKDQAQIAIASGWGLVGKGPGNSTQRANLPEAYSDFAYAFIIEEYGAPFATFILFLYLLLFFRTIAIFRKCGTAFPSLLVLGLGLLIVMQALTNMMVSVGLFPVTGQTLPMISRGGSSLLFTSFALGMILGVSRQIDEQTLDTPKEESLLEK